MAVTETIAKRTAVILLNNGTSASGVAQTVNVSLGTLNKDAWDADKAMAIVEALESCFEKTINKVQTTGTFNMTSSS